MRSLLLPGALGMLIGFLGYWGWTVTGHSEAPATPAQAAAIPAADDLSAPPAPATLVTPRSMPPPPSEGIVNHNADAAADAGADADAEIFKIFPKDQWVQMPRGLMEHANSPFDTLLFVSRNNAGDGEFWPTMMPGVSEATLQAIAAPLQQFSRGWTELAVAHLQRSGADEWQATLPPDQINRLRQGLESNLTNTLPPGFGHLVRVFAHRPLALLSVPTITLTFDPSSNGWALAINRSGHLHTINMSEEHLAPAAPVRELLERARTLK